MGTNTVKQNEGHIDSLQGKPFFNPYKWLFLWRKIELDPFYCDKSNNWNVEILINNDLKECDEFHAEVDKNYYPYSCKFSKNEQRSVLHAECKNNVSTEERLKTLMKRWLVIMCHQYYL